MGRIGQTICFHLSAGRILALINHICIILASLSGIPGKIGPDFSGHVGPDSQARMAQISRPDWPGSSGWINLDFLQDWPGFQSHRYPDFQAKFAQIFRPDWPRYSGLIGQHFQVRLARTSRPCWPGFSGQDFQARLTRISRPVWP